MAIRYKDGIVVGADSRTSVSGYVSNPFATKINFVLDARSDDYSTRQHRSLIIDEKKKTGEMTTGTPLSTCCICRSGSAADTQTIIDTLEKELLTRRILHRIHGSVTHAAKILRNIILDDPNVSASLLCAGYDHLKQRGIIYSIAPGGTLCEEKDGWAIGGSGSTYLLGYLDSHFPKLKHSRDDCELLWEEEEAVSFLHRAIELAMGRDGHSGGSALIYVVDRNGKRCVLSHKKPRMKK